MALLQLVDACADRSLFSGITYVPTHYRKSAHA